ncbi:MAG: metal dependent phosphohydrolase [Holophagaceae bacterium]|nr:metal dependent phosphohydrolase [Holophagaceae bacterium]
MTQPLLKTLKEGDPFVGFLLALETAYKTSAKGTEYLEAKLGDASGDLKAFLWDLRAVEGDLDLVQPEAFLKVKGTVTSFNGRLQFKLDKVRFATDEEVGDLSQFFPTSERPIDEMLGELDRRIEGVRDPWIRKLLSAILQENTEHRQAFSRAPAAKSMHHVCLGGLLEHTLSVASMAERACAHYQQLNADLVMAGVLLHDLGKTAELTYQRSFGYSDVGNLLGHISLETLWISQAMDKLGPFPEELRLQILHIVLSHHGRQEFGSPVVPKTPEALLVHYLDDLDGKLEGIFKGIQDGAGTGNWTPYSRSLERSLYTVRWPKSL